MSATHILFPDSKAPRCDQYPRAWKLLLSPTTQEDERAHAKCWLTYRCADGEVKYDDYLRLIRPTTPDFSKMAKHEHARWVVSITAADVFASVLNATDSDWRDVALDLWRFCFDKAVRIHPPAVSSFVGVSLILAYDAYLSGDTEKARNLIIKTWDRYKVCCAEWNWRHMVYRPMEAVRDMHYLQMIQFVGSQVGVVREINPWATWCTPATMVAKGGTGVDVPIRCAIRLGLFASDKSRVIFPDPDKTEREVIADYAGDGLFVELGVAAGAFAERVLDRNRGMKYVGIDKWDDHHNVAEMEKAATKLSRFGGRAELKRMSFESAVEGFQNESCDVIYVDGYAHTGQDEGKTLRDWWPKVKAGGVFSGHDYDEKWPKTVAAVDAFAESVGAAVEVIKDEPFSSWVIRKPALDLQITRSNFDA